VAAAAGARPLAQGAPAAGRRQSGPWVGAWEPRAPGVAPAAAAEEAAAAPARALASRRPE
jgi:hypothetical protein